MSDAMRVDTNPDGTVTARVGENVRVFPDMQAAVAWATRVLYDLEGEECG